MTITTIQAGQIVTAMLTQLTSGEKVDTRSIDDLERADLLVLLAWSVGSLSGLVASVAAVSGRPPSEYVQRWGLTLAIAETMERQG